MTAVDVVAALRVALRAEHAAVYGYGVVGGQLWGAEQDQARAAYDAHRARRDRLAALLLDRGAPAPAAAPAYALPEPARNRDTARRLAAGLELAAAARYAQLVGASGPDEGEVRRLAATALQDAAVRATGWGAPTAAFPGLPERSPAVPASPTRPPTPAPRPAS